MTLDVPILSLYTDLFFFLFCYLFIYSSSLQVGLLLLVVCVCVCVRVCVWGGGLGLRGSFWPKQYNMGKQGIPLDRIIVKLL